MSDRRVLVVDDDPDLRRLVEVTLTSYQVSLASSLSEACRLLELEPIDVVILDLYLGGAQDGLGVCSRAQELASPPKVIMVSGSDSAEDQERCLKLGAIAYLTKPFRPLQLLELLKSCLE
ncbi:MAG: response regulator [Planctomycetes bacterium]|nr:response regulator [Planctomycetota bacterium]